MKKFLLVVLMILVAACGSLNSSGPSPSTPQAQVRIAPVPVAPGDGIGNPVDPPVPPVMCPIPCCNNSVTFMCLYGVSISPAGPSVPINSSVMVAFRDPQDPALIALTVSPKVNCSWIWAEDFKQTTCTPQGTFAAFPGLGYGTTYTVDVKRWLPLGRGWGYWSEWLSNSFTTEAQPVFVAMGNER